jgi:serine/threonine protein kinase
MGCTAATGLHADHQANALCATELDFHRFHSAYVLGDLIGTGSFGSVFSARERGKSGSFAVRIVALKDEQSSGEANPQTGRRLREFRNEVDAAWQASSHPNCVHVYASFDDDLFGYLVMELCPYDLLGAFKSEPELNELTLAQYFRGMLSALRHIHGQRIVHRDVKLRNFLLSGSSAERVVKLCDFGLATRLPDSGSLSGVKGTVPYMAPEMLTARYGCGVDVWSLGVIVYILFFGKFPCAPKHGTPNAVKFAIAHGTPAPNFASDCSCGPIVSKHAVSFVKVLLSRDPCVRPSATVALECDYLDVDASRTRASRSKVMSLKSILRRAVMSGAFGDRIPLDKFRINTAIKAKLGRLQQAASSDQADFVRGEVCGSQNNERATSGEDQRSAPGDIQSESKLHVRL